MEEIERTLLTNITLANHQEVAGVNEDEFATIIQDSEYLSIFINNPLNLGVLTEEQVAAINALN